MRWLIVADSARRQTISRRVSIGLTDSINVKCTFLFSLSLALFSILPRAETAIYRGSELAVSGIS